MRRLAGRLDERLDMILIAQIEVTRPFPVILACRLYAMQIGDRLTVQQDAHDREADIPPALAKDLLLRGFAKVPGATEDSDA